MTEIQAVPGRRQELIRVASLMLSYAILGAIWLAIFRVFLGHMTPRLEGIFYHFPLVNSPPCDAPQCDFSVFWPAGLLARSGNFTTLYDPSAFEAFRDQVLFSGEQPLDWFYTPFSLLPVALISYLPFGYAFIVWDVTSAALAVFILRSVGISWQVIIVSLLSPAALWNFMMGQWEFFCGATLAAGLFVQMRKKRCAGMLLGLMVLKPQTALAVPVGLLANYAWRTVIYSLLTVAAIAILTTVVLGLPIWSAWINYGIGVAHQTLVAGHSVGLEESISAFWAARNFGAPVPLAYGIQIAYALFGLSVTLAVWKQPGFLLIERTAITVFAGLLITPYAFIVDMVAYEIVLALLAERYRWRIDPLDALFWLWPMLSPAIYIWTGWLITPLVLIMVIARTWHRAGIGLPHLPRFKPVLPRAG